MHTLTFRFSLLTALLVGGMTMASNAQGLPQSSTTSLPSQEPQGKQVDGARASKDVSFLLVDGVPLTREQVDNARALKDVSFYVLDGVPVTREHLNTITPSQIEAISVVKDKLTLASYGPPAQNGAVLITTKK